MTARTDLVGLLDRSGWVRISEGPAGDLWVMNASGQRVGVPHDLDRDSPEWPGVIKRIALAMAQDIAALEFRLAHQHLDETRLSASHSDLIGDSILLSAGQRLVDSASRMLRAAATTARSPRASIGKYSSEGDRVFGLARMGHTQRGSYVVPVLMPIPDPEPDAILFGTSLVDDTPAEPAMRPEPIERRTMRTFAEALTAVDRLVVQPAVQPRASVAGALVVAGVSKQFLDALHAIVVEDSVQTFTARFNWAESRPSSATSPVSIPNDAARLISDASMHLSRETVEPTQQLTGPIVEWHRDHGASDGWVGMQTLRHGHLMVIRVHLDTRELDRALRYIEGKQTAVVLGVPRGGRGKTVQIQNPDTFTSLDEMMLPLSDQAT
ncbi:MAG: hypothetical protein WKF57_06590 [Nakamurella sp.]